MGTNPFESDFSFADYAAEIEQLTPPLTKVETLAKNKEAKLDLLGQTTRNKFYDADTFYQGRQGVRLGDPTGTYAQAPEAPATIEKKFGRPATPQEVAEYETSMKVLDNYFAGVIPAPKEAIQGLLDQPLSAEDQALYDQYIKQTPMATAETTGIEGHTGRFGRQVAQVQVPGQEDTLQERLIGSGIAPEKMGTSAFERLPSTSIYAGAAPSDTDGMIGESVDIAQSSLLQEWGKIGKVAAKAGRWIGESLGVDKKTMEAIMPDKSGLFDESFTNLAKQEVADKMTGVMAKTREEQQAGMEAALKNIKDGDYGKAAWESIKILPYMLGDSAGEMAAIMAGTPGITMAVAARVNEDAEEYKKNNKKEPDAQWLLGSTLLNAGALFGEKFLVKSGIGGIIEKGVSKAKRTGGIAASAIGEATQEYYDQVQQEFMTQKEGEKTLGEIATSPEAQLGALAGGVMGGALRGVGEAGGVVADRAKPVAGRIQEEIDRRKAIKAEQEAAIAEAEQAEKPANLTAIYGGEEGVRTKEAEYQTTIDTALEKGDIHSAAIALTQYKSDLAKDDEGLFDKNEFATRVAKAKEMMAAHETKIVEGEASKEEAQTFGSSPEMVDAVMENKSAEEAEQFLQTFSTKYGSEAADRIKQHVEAKKSLVDVGEDVSKDILAKTKAINEAKTEDQRNNAIEDFERFKLDRSSRYGRLESWVKTLEQDLQAEANQHSDPEEYLRELAAATNRSPGKRNSDHKYTTKGIHTTENFAYRSDIAKQLLKGDRKHNKGVYEVLGNKEAELVAFDRQAELLGLKETAQPVVEEAPITERVVEETAPVEEVAEEVAEPTEEVTPVVEEPIKVAEEPAKGGKVPSTVVEESVEAVPTKTEILASIKELVDAKKFDEAKEIIDNSNLSKVAKKNLLKRIEYRKPVSTPTEEVVEVEPVEEKKEVSLFDQVKSLVGAGNFTEAIQLVKDSNRPKQIKDRLIERIEAVKKQVKNFVSEDIIGKSKLIALSNIVLTTRPTTSKLSVDPRAGQALSDELSSLDKSLSIESINGIIQDKFTVEGRKYVVENTISNDPARILFDKQGKLHPNVTATISKALIEYLLKYGTNLIAQDPKQVAQMLGYGDNVDAMPADAVKLVGNRTFKKNVADVLGKIIMNDLGLKVDPEADAKLTKKYKGTKVTNTINTEEKFIASLGQMAAIIGGEIGIFTTVDNIAEENKLSAEQYAEIAAGVEKSNVEHTGIDMVGIGDLGRKLVTSKDMYTKFNEIMETFSDGSYLKDVKTSPIKGKPVKQKVDVEVFQPSAFNKKTINNARKQAWRMDFAALDLFKQHEDLVKEYLGYVETGLVLDSEGNDKEVILSMSYVDEQNQIAKNNSIDLKLRLLENLRERIQEQGEDTDLFFEYFYGSNGRYYLDNNEANPQNDKFNRFMLGLASNNVEVDLSKDSKSTDTFYIALAQAFGEDIDKMSTEKSIAAGKAWLEKGSKAITKELKDRKFEPEEVGHVLQGILAVQAFENASGKPFNTNLVIETDAVTSGIILKTLQLPVMGIEKAKQLLKKGGIVFRGDVDYDTFVGTNKLIEDGQLDLYRELAKTYSGKIDAYLEEGKWKLRPAEGQELSSRQQYVNDRRERLLAASKEGGIMPEFSTDPDKIKGKLRSIFKPVVMVFGYGGGIGSIKHKFVSEIIEQLPTKLLAEVEVAQAALKAGEPKPDMPILNFFKAVAPKQKITVSMLRESDILSKKVTKNKTIRDIMVEDMTALYGDLLEGSLSDIFGPELTEANRKLNNSFRMMFRIFDYKYKKQLAEFEKSNGRKPSAEEKAEMIIDLQDSFPAVAPPFAKDTEKGIIIDTRTSADTRVKAQTMGNFERGDGQMSISVAAIVKEFEEAISAGNVVPIHYIDASIMGTTFNNIDNITQIFDAIVSNVSNGFEANQEYNKQTIKVSKEYSLTTKVLESLQQSVDTLTDAERIEFLSEENRNNDNFTIGSFGEEADALTFEDVVSEMRGLDRVANVNRRALLNTDLKVDHMTGLGAVVEVKGDEIAQAESTVESREQEAHEADLQHYGSSQERAVEPKSKNGILPYNKTLKRATNSAINKECK